MRLAPGGEIVDEIAAPEGLDVFACMLGGDDGRTLLMCAAPDFVEQARSATHEAVLLTTTVDVPHAGPAVIRFGLLGPAAAWQRRPRSSTSAARSSARCSRCCCCTATRSSRPIGCSTSCGRPGRRPTRCRCCAPTSRACARAARHRRAGRRTTSGYELRAATRSTPTASRRCVAAARAELEAATRPSRRCCPRRSRSSAARRCPSCPTTTVAGAERDRLEELRASPRRSSSRRRLAQGRHRELRAGAARGRRRRAAARAHVGAADGRALPLRPPGRGARRLPRRAARARPRSRLAAGPQLRALERMILLQDAALEPAVGARLPRYRTSFVGPRGRARRGRGRRARRGGS